MDSSSPTGEKFRIVSVETGPIEVDPAHYVSAAQMAWDAMLKKTGIVLDLISDPAMYRMIESGMRGGICMISKRHAKANNPALGPLYDPEQPNSYIIYLDANNLYGWAMSQFLPQGKFEWVPQEEFDKIKWQGIGDWDRIGYIVECDLEYPAELHEMHNDYPMAPERVRIDISMVSDTQVDIARHYARSRTQANVKLVPNLMNKTRYVTLGLSLKFYLDHGMRLTKVHRVIKFNQSAWMEPYITMNTWIA